MNYFNYFTEIEDTFVRRRGKHLFLSPLDWAMIEAWQDRGIPLHIVIRSIESVFDVYDKQPPAMRTRTIKSLFYCREEIEVQYNEWQTSQTGRSQESEVGSPEPEFSKESISGHIEKSIATLKAVSMEGLKEDIARAISRLDELTGSLSSDFESIDKTLSDIEKLIDRAMLTHWESSHLKTLKKEIAGQLRIYKSEMEPDAYKNTFELMLLKRLREEAGVPRLGLFYL
ncbi:MAG: hypothetical protein IPL32_11965 [Chloracidobacterium sp.]|nr:hypothetical protein [Chloracidobacterium sp.]